MKCIKFKNLVKKLESIFIDNLINGGSETFLVVSDSIKTYD